MTSGSSINWTTLTDAKWKTTQCPTRECKSSTDTDCYHTIQNIPKENQPKSFYATEGGNCHLLYSIEDNNKYIKKLPEDVRNNNTASFTEYSIEHVNPEYTKQLNRPETSYVKQQIYCKPDFSSCYSQYFDCNTKDGTCTFKGQGPMI